jgi:hypothetical protein
MGENMRTILLHAFAAVAITLGAHPALAQPVNGCPAGQAMQSSDPSGHKITCVPVGGGEVDIIGQWAVSGTTTCLSATGGFNLQNFAPLITSATTSVSQLAGTFLGTRTFYAGGTGRSISTNHLMTFPSTNFAAGVAPIPFGTGAASTSTGDASFKWAVRSDGTLVIEDDGSVGQRFTAPPSLLGQMVTIENLPTYEGYISKDKRVIMLTHAGMSMETSIRRDASGAELSRSPRFCARLRALTRLLS